MLWRGVHAIVQRANTEALDSKTQAVALEVLENNCRCPQLPDWPIYTCGFGFDGSGSDNMLSAGTSKSPITTVCTVTSTRRRVFFSETHAVDHTIPRPTWKATLLFVISRTPKDPFFGVLQCEIGYTEPPRQPVGCQIAIPPYA